MRDEEILAKALVDLDDADVDVDTFISRRSDLSPSVKAALRAVAWARRAPRPAPTAAFRARARRGFLAAASEPRGRSVPWRRWVVGLAPSLRTAVAPMGFTLAVIIGVAGVYTASAEALPDTPFYSAKLAFDQVRVLTAFTPDNRAQAHLAAANERLAEARAESRAGRVDAAAALMVGYETEVARARGPSIRIPASTPTIPRLVVVAVPSSTPPERPDVARKIASTDTPVPSVAPTEDTPPSVTTRSDVVPPAVHSPVPAVPTSPPLPTHVLPVLARASGPPVVPHRADSQQPARPPAKPAHPVEPPAEPTEPPGVPPSPTPPPAATLAPTALPSGSDSEILLRTLIRQASESDPAASATLQLYTHSLDAAKAAGDGWATTLGVERTQLLAAIEHVPTSQRSVIQHAIDALNQELGDSTTQSVPRRDAPPSRTPIPPVSRTPVPAVTTVPTHGHDPTPVSRPTEVPAAGHVSTPVSTAVVDQSAGHPPTMAARSVSSAGPARDPNIPADVGPRLTHWGRR